MRRFFAHGRRTFRIALYRIHKLCFSRRPDHARLPDIEIIEHVIASIEFLLEIPCVVASPFDFFICVDLAWSRLPYTNNPNRRSAIGDNRRPILGANLPMTMYRFSKAVLAPRRTCFDFQSACAWTKSIPCLLLFVSLLWGSNSKSTKVFVTHLHAHYD